MSVVVQKTVSDLGLQWSAVEYFKRVGKSKEIAREQETDTGHEAEWLGAVDHGQEVKRAKTRSGPNCRSFCPEPICLTLPHLKN